MAGLPRGSQRAGEGICATQNSPCLSPPHVSPGPQPVLTSRTKLPLTCHLCWAPPTHPPWAEPIPEANRRVRQCLMSGTLARPVCALDPSHPGTTLPAPPATHVRWGLQVSVDDVVSENVPGPQGAHTTSDVAVPSRKNGNPSPTQILSRTTGPSHRSPRRSLRSLRARFTSIP